MQHNPKTKLYEIEEILWVGTFTCILTTHCLVLFLIWNGFFEEVTCICHICVYQHRLVIQSLMFKVGTSQLSCCLVEMVLYPHNGADKIIILLPLQ